MPLIAKCDSHGKIVDYVFRPTAKQTRYAFERTRPENFNKSQSEIFEKVNLTHERYKDWIDNNVKIVNGHERSYFTEWLEEAMEMYGAGDFKDALFRVGMEEALKANPQFWKPMAIQFGVISPDRLETTLKIQPIRLDEIENLSDAELKAKEEALLAEIMGNEEAASLSSPVKNKSTDSAD